MSVNDSERAPVEAAAPILVRAGGADAREHDRLAAGIDDFFLPEDARLDDRTRAAMTAVVAATVGAVEREIAGHAARLLSTRGAGAIADRLARRTTSVLPRLTRSGLLRDADLMAELIGRVRQDLLAEGLIPTPGRVDRPSLLARLADCPDGVVAAAAGALLVADSRRRGGAAVSTELPAELHHRIVWWVAAALREDHAAEASDTLDRALAEAAARSLAAHDEGERPEAVATRLAAAIDARPDELAELLIDTLGDARVTLFVAVIAQAAGLGYAEARAIALDPEGDRLWLVLRAHALDRAAIARIALILADADRRRSIDAFADSLDAIAAITPEAARTALAPLRLHPDFRAALRALARSERR